MKLRPLAVDVRPTLLNAMRGVQQALSVAGVRCVLDSRDLPIPGAYLAPPTISYRFGSGMDLRHRLVLVVSNTDRERALAEMSSLLVTAQAALSDAIVTATPTEVETADQTAFLVAYECIWTERKEPTS